MTERERLREDALASIEAAIAAVDPSRLVREHFHRQPDGTGASERVRIAAIGKAAAPMARAAVEALGDRVAGGVLVAPAGQETAAPPGFAAFGAGHPVPDEGSVAGARAVRDLARGAGPGELLLVLLSGGGSALLTLPPDGIALADVRATTDALLRAGATIAELNAVRKHLDALKGGRLAREVRGRVLALILSDVVGDPLDVIASGPVSPDPTTYADAIAILRRLAVWEDATVAVRAHLERGGAGDEPESPKAGEPCFARVEARIVGNNAMAVDAARAAAAARGYGTLVLTTVLTGEAREIGRALAAIALEVRRSGRPLPAPACILAAGETTVRVTGRGRGGRNQELALGAALALDGAAGIAVASAGTDGVDGPTDAAGAIAFGDTVARARARGLSPAAALAENDSYPFFQALGDLIVTGPTGTNVMDVMVALVARGAE